MPRQRLRGAAECAGVDVAGTSDDLPGNGAQVVQVPVEDQPGAAWREQAVHSGRVGVGDRICEAALRLIEGVVKKGDRHAADLLSGHPGPGRHGRTQRRVELGVDPTLVRKLRFAYSVRPGAQEAEGEPGVMVAHDRAQPRFVEEAVEHLSGERADPNGVAGVVDGGCPASPNRRQRGVEGRES